MGNRALAGMSGAAKGFERGINNMFEIMQAKDRLKMEREKFDINKQQSKLNLKKLSYELDPERLAQADKMEKDKIKLGELEFKIKQQKLDTTESENAREVETHRSDLEIKRAMLQRMFPGGLKVDQGGNLAPGTSITQDGMTIKSKQPSRWEIDKEARTRANAIVKNPNFMPPAGADFGKVYSKLYEQEHKRLMETHRPGNRGSANTSKKPAEERADWWNV